MSSNEKVEEAGTASRIVRNASYMMMSQLATWSMTIVFVVIVPRFLGSGNFGQFTLAESIWLIASIVAFFGIETHLTKTIARNPAKLSILYSSSVINTTFNFVITFGGVLLFSWISGYQTAQIQLIALVGIAYYANVISTVSMSVLNGLERLDTVSKTFTLNKAIHTIFAVGALLLGSGLFQYAIAIVCAYLINCVLMVRALYRTHAFKLEFDFATSVDLYKSGLPYFFSGIFAILYKEFDIIIMSWLIQEPEQFGFYGTADRLAQTLMFVPTVLITALFPVLSRMHGEGSDLLPIYIGKSFNILLVLSIPIGLGVSVIAEPVILLFYGPEYIDAAKILEVLGFVVILTYQTTLLGYFLISIDKQNIWTITMAVATVATIPLDLILIPWASSFGPAGVGGAFAYLFTEGGMVIVGLYLIPKGYINKSNYILALKAIISGAVMYTALTYLDDLGFVAKIFLGGAIYPAMILLLRTIPKDDMDLLKTLFEPVTNRLPFFRSG
ncbi:MAG: flippase [Chloroflexota bacterium]